MGLQLWKPEYSQYCSKKQKEVKKKNSQGTEIDIRLELSGITQFHIFEKSSYYYWCL